MVSHVLFTGLVAAAAIQRLAEVRHSRRNERALVAQGAREHARWQVPLLAGLHTCWLAAIVVETWWGPAPFRPWLALAALSVFMTGQALRLRAMRALGSRWTIRVMTLPGTPAVTGGIYRYLRHPNYVGVALEIAALPLVHGAVWTSAVFTVANTVVLALRIRAEERALSIDNAYLDAFGGRPRFVPSAPRRHPLP
jgi:methyltransferase